MAITDVIYPILPIHPHPDLFQQKSPEILLTELMKPLISKRAPIIPVFTYFAVQTDRARRWNLSKLQNGILPEANTLWVGTAILQGDPSSKEHDILCFLPQGDDGLPLMFFMHSHRYGESGELTITIQNDGIPVGNPQKPLFPKADEHLPEDLFRVSTFQDQATPDITFAKVSISLI